MSNHKRILLELSPSLCHCLSGLHFLPILFPCSLHNKLRLLDRSIFVNGPLQPIAVSIVGALKVLYKFFFYYFASHLKLIWVTPILLQLNYRFWFYLPVCVCEGHCHPFLLMSAVSDYFHSITFWVDKAWILIISCFTLTVNIFLTCCGLLLY